MDGKASFSVVSACSRGLKGRGGFGGGASASAPGFEGVELMPASWGSSSKSKGRAVVGDSGFWPFPPEEDLVGVLVCGGFDVSYFTVREGQRCAQHTVLLSAILYDLDKTKR